MARLGHMHIAYRFCDAESIATGHYEGMTDLILIYILKLICENGGLISSSSFGASRHPSQGQIIGIFVSL
jgi:hypothetical protein